MRYGKRNLDSRASYQSRSTYRANELRVAEIAARLHAAYLERDLGNLPDPVEELVYICLTRQTHRWNALRSWERLQAAGGPSALQSMAEDDVTDLVRDAGLSRQKARWIRGSLRLISERFGELSLATTADWPDDDLQGFLASMPGIGIKTAKCIMLYSMGRQVLPVDTHVRRVSERIGLVPPGMTERKIHSALEAAVPPMDRYGYHVNCVWHGRKVCTALRPRCNECPLVDLCDHGRVQTGNHAGSRDASTAEWR